MKKLLVALLLATMSFALIGCGKSNEENVPSEEVVSEENSDVSEEASDDVSEDTNAEDAVVSDNAGVEILTNVWNAFAEEEKFFVWGGDYDVAVDGAPGAFNVTNMDYLTTMIYVPTDFATDIDEGATLFHAQNFNIFTGAALHLTDASNAETFITALKENLLGIHWTCGSPDTLVIFTINDDYVLYAFGNVDAIATFKAKVAEVYGESAILVAEENLAG